MAGNLGRVVPVRIAEYDDAAKSGEGTLRGRLGTTFVTDYDQNAPKERGGAPPVERLPEDIEPGERAQERQAEGAGTKKASRGRGEKAFDVLDEEAKSAPSGRRAERKARDDEGDILF